MVTMARSTPRRRGALVSAAQDSGSFAFVMFCVFVVSYFLRFTQRVPFLGAARFDMVIAALTLAAILFGAKARDEKLATSDVGKRLLILLGYIVCTIPFVQWPGSVLAKGIEPFLKAVSFYYFVVSTVDSMGKLKTIVGLYVGCQMFRILEPLYMHLTTGYWGSFAMGSDWSLMDRLAGSPYDIINPNGLGFVVVTTLPLLHYFCPPKGAFRKLLYAALLLAAMYTLMLTGSRSAFLALTVLAAIVIWRSERRALLTGVAVVVAIVGISLMDDMQRDRYMSIYSHDTISAGSAEGRLDGVIGDLKVAAQRPLFGFGLGNSREANANYRGEDRLSHDLYTEVAQELGFIGLAIFIAVLVAMVQSCYRVKRAVAGAENKADAVFLRHFSESLLVLIMVYLFFSFASYGLSEPYWYFIGGLASATTMLAARAAIAGTSPATSNLNPQERP
jgi:hypothetical protein